MAAIIGAIRLLFAGALGRWLIKTIAKLGIGIVSYEGASVVLGQLQGYVTGLIGGLPADAATAFCAVGGNAAVSIIFAAYSARFAAGVVNRLGIKTTPST